MLSTVRENFSYWVTEVVKGTRNLLFVTAFVVGVFVTAQPVSAASGSFSYSEDSFVHCRSASDTGNFFWDHNHDGSVSASVPAGTKSKSFSGVGWSIAFEALTSFQNAFFGKLSLGDTDGTADGELGNSFGTVSPPRKSPSPEPSLWSLWTSSPLDDGCNFRIGQRNVSAEFLVNKIGASSGGGVGVGGIAGVGVESAWAFNEPPKWYSTSDSIDAAISIIGEETPRWTFGGSGGGGLTPISSGSGSGGLLDTVAGSNNAIIISQQPLYPITVLVDSRDNSLINNNIYSTYSCGTPSYYKDAAEDRYSGEVAIPAYAGGRAQYDFKTNRNEVEADASWSCTGSGSSDAWRDCYQSGTPELSPFYNRPVRYYTVPARVVSWGICSAAGGGIPTEYLCPKAPPPTDLNYGEEAFQAVYKTAYKSTGGNVMAVTYNVAETNPPLPAGWDSDLGTTEGSLIEWARQVSATLTEAPCSGGGPPPENPIICEVSADSNPSVPSEKVTWSVEVASGPGGPYRYRWSGDDGLSGVSTTAEKEYDSPGAYRGTVEVRDDKSGQTASCSNVVTINEPLQVACSATPNPSPINEEVTWRSFPTGGVAPYRYLWLDGEEFSREQSAVRSYSESGTYAAAVMVTDSRDNTASCLASVGITDEPVPGTGPGVSLLVNGQERVSVPSGNPVTLSWKITNPPPKPQCAASSKPVGLWSGSKLSEGEEKSLGGITEQTDFTIICWPFANKLATFSDIAAAEAISGISGFNFWIISPWNVSAKPGESVSHTVTVEQVSGGTLDRDVSLRLTSSSLGIVNQAIGSVTLESDNDRATRSFRIDVPAGTPAESYPVTITGENLEDTDPRDNSASFNINVSSELVVCKAVDSITNKEIKAGERVPVEHKVKWYAYDKDGQTLAENDYRFAWSGDNINFGDLTDNNPFSKVYHTIGLKRASVTACPEDSWSGGVCLVAPLSCAIETVNKIRVVVQPSFEEF